MPVPPRSDVLICPRGLPARNAAFTLIELLVVIGIIVAMTALMVPALSFIKGGSDLGIAGSKISGMLEQARAYAMSRNTCVWVGLMNVNPGGPLALGAVYSKDGTANTNSSNLSPLGKFISIDNTCLASVVLPATGNLARQAADFSLPMSNSTTSFSLPHGGTNSTFTNTIGFNSQGVAVTQGFDSIPRIIELGLIPSRGTNSSSAVPSNVVVLQISGITGAVKTFRP